MREKLYYIHYPALTSFWNYHPLPRTIIEKHGDDWVNPAYIQTNGSYQLAQWQKKSLVILKKNPLVILKKIQIISRLP